MTLPVQVFAKGVPGAWPMPTAERIQPVTEHLCGRPKPDHGGGLWTSSLLDDGSSDWIRWCLSEQFSGPEFDLWHLTPDPTVRIYTIDSYDDLAMLAVRFSPVCDHARPCLQLGLDSGVSWRRVADAYDAVRVTEEGQWRTRLSMPLNLYGWDCEATVWFRWAFTRVEHVGRRTFAAAEVD